MTSPTDTENAYVLGGGVAGLVTAFGLADRGFRVHLLESRRWLGGRAFSSPDPVTGWRLDNGPHVMLGCYREMRRLLDRLGTASCFRQDRRLELAYRCVGGRRLSLALAPLPVPLALPAALLGFGMSFSARLRALRGLVGVLRRAPVDWTVEQWLARRGQTGEPDAFLWRPLCRAIMNGEPSEVAAIDFLSTLRQAFLGRAATAAFWVPRRTWGEVLAEPAAAALGAAGVQLRVGSRVARFDCAEGRVAAIELAGGERIAVGADDLVVSALPWFVLRPLLPAVPLAIGDLRSSPIVSAFFATAPLAPPLPDDGPVTALVDGDPFHFVLRTPGADVRRFALLSGGGRSFDRQSVELIAERARHQVLRHYPGMSLEGAVVRIRKEQHATFVAACGSASQRPEPGRLPGGPQNLWVAGDWTRTGLPSTLEGAARSGASVVLAISRASRRSS